MAKAACWTMTDVEARKRGEQTGLDTRVVIAVSYTHLRAHETPEHLVCRLLLEKKKTINNKLYMMLRRDITV